MPEVPTQPQPTSNQKSINWKRILIIAVIGAVVIGVGVLIFLIIQQKEETTTPPKTPTPSTSDKVGVTTNKTEYKQGEEAQIRIKNISSEVRTVYRFDFGIERFERRHWSMVRVNVCGCPGVACEAPESYSLEPGETHEIMWDQEERTCEYDDESGFKNKSASTGKYRAYIYLSSGSTMKKMYSNEFRIK